MHFISIKNRECSCIWVICLNVPTNSNHSYIHSHAFSCRLFPWFAPLVPTLRGMRSRLVAPPPYCPALAGRLVLLHTCPPSITKPCASPWPHRSPSEDYLLYFYYHGQSLFQKGSRTSVEERIKPCDVDRYCYGGSKLFSVALSFPVFSAPPRMHHQRLPHLWSAPCDPRMKLTIQLILRDYIPQTTYFIEFLLGANGLPPRRPKVSCSSDQWGMTHTRSTRPELTLSFILPGILV